MSRLDFDQIRAALPGLGFTVASARFDDHAFGSWLIAAKASDIAVRIVCDGRDGRISIEQGRRGLFGIGPRSWSPLLTTVTPQTLAAILAQIAHLPSRK